MESALIRSCRWLLLSWIDFQYRYLYITWVKNRYVNGGGRGGWMNRVAERLFLSESYHFKHGAKEIAQWLKCLLGNQVSKADVKACLAICTCNPDLLLMQTGNESNMEKWLRKILRSQPQSFTHKHRQMYTAPRIHRAQRDPLQKSLLTKLTHL